MSTTQQEKFVRLVWLLCAIIYPFRDCDVMLLSIANLEAFAVEAALSFILTIRD